MLAVLTRGKLASRLGVLASALLALRAAGPKVLASPASVCLRAEMLLLLPLLACCHRRCYYWPTLFVAVCCCCCCCCHHHVLCCRHCSDLVMLVSFGSAKERNRAQFRSLFEASGWQLNSVTPTSSLFMVVEAQPV